MYEAILPSVLACFNTITQPERATKKNAAPELAARRWLGTFDILTHCFLYTIIYNLSCAEQAGRGFQLHGFQSVSFSSFLPSNQNDTCALSLLFLKPADLSDADVKHSEFSDVGNVFHLSRLMSCQLGNHLEFFYPDISVGSHIDKCRESMVYYYSILQGQGQRVTDSPTHIHPEPRIPRQIEFSNRRRISRVLNK